MIPFNKQNLFGKELEYIKDAFDNGKVSGDGKYTKLCSNFMEERFKSKKILLTSSGTDALELAALLSDIKEGDEVILPSYTFVSTANAFVLRGAKLVYCDIREDNLNIDEEKIEGLITDKTKAIVPVHYAGVACDMDKIMKIAKKYNLLVIEDAAQGVDAKYKDKYLGTIGDIGCYSFHETKNFSAGEGGAVSVNNPRYLERAEIIREKGTNRSQFFRGEVDKYTWVDIGSSYLLSDINAAVLYHQLENIEKINQKRKEIFEAYYNGLMPLQHKRKLRLPIINEYARTNYHMFYIILNTEEERDNLMDYLKENGIHSVFHYIPLHESKYSKERFGSFKLPITENLSRRLLRLPMYYSLELREVKYIVEKIQDYLERVTSSPTNFMDS
ncbi:dTDP-4-amino-4,6-dideoxygalactose transaminase [Petrotoga sp. Shatin.DS.tank11.9.2.9.3]|jgi:dTDP-4-amino-4,6-dideoxygalactose transaminase|uniref:dTDP-4-amino-4,6-dideoxygalactose transaminase n=1 Tax=Petrotoga sp. Shatin.DS.tank11.9.2.9.3 TaxID=1469556 RepID=UPI000EF1E428|nr:dTDP-4-amino-4,6-dideoxygalactose transaminase [Petrotoga sp. Shatin.DS.tank11.9.2.9.3]RLL83195.1 TDP-4-oxo-6-deoxy-D-glucose aminotransferase [Petrotoga sp. Shatin.DS.tank11.9.2.9.3]